MIYIQRLLCTVIKFHDVIKGKEAKEAVLHMYFVQDFYYSTTVRISST